MFSRLLTTFLKGLITALVPDSAGFHYDLFLFGIISFIAGLIGIPAPNGLIPQAPIHMSSLVVMGHPSKKSDGEGQTCNDIRDLSLVPIGVVEQRVSNLAQGMLCLVLLTGPFSISSPGKCSLCSCETCLFVTCHYGLVHGCTLQGNGITLKLLYLLRDKSLTPFNEPLHKVCKSRLVLFIAIQLIGFGATFSITQTIAAIGFLVVVLLLVPPRTLVIPRLPFTPEELAILDGPTAFPFTMASIGGSLHVECMTNTLDGNVEYLISMVLPPRRAVALRSVQVRAWVWWSE
ncbi:hypothetical protein JVT61DRAFT_6306 [Boletus reticuloceps]|uniref:Bicarbonate transporter-like transmembrane domain-containing protein n=1 Tax=Boletus reticuloceps TaxID=495285 RepID=A0A8I3A6L4_9AGAM|nr:hypothetical protein JVT61DRAFT_6306 [Boletus reticuloceps]